MHVILCATVTRNAMEIAVAFAHRLLVVPDMSDVSPVFIYLFIYLLYPQDRGITEGSG